MAAARVAQLSCASPERVRRHRKCALASADELVQVWPSAVGHNKWPAAGARPFRLGAHSTRAHLRRDVRERQTDRQRERRLRATIGALISLSPAPPLSLAACN